MCKATHGLCCLGINNRYSKSNAPLLKSFISLEFDINHMSVQVIPCGINPPSLVPALSMNNSKRLLDAPWEGENKIIVGIDIGVNESSIAFTFLEQGW